MIDAVVALAPTPGLIAGACAALNLSRASVYRQRRHLARPTSMPRLRPKPPRALGAIPDAQIDARYGRTAGNLRHLAARMADVPDDLFMQVAALQTLVGEPVSKLITARLFAIHFDILPYASATEFYRSLVAVGRGGSSGRLN